VRERGGAEPAGSEASSAPQVPAAAQAPPGPEAFAALDAGLGSLPSVRALQRAVGNRTLARLVRARALARQKAAAQPAPKGSGERWAFIMGAAVKGKKKDGADDIDTFYLAATRYFEQELGKDRVRKDVRSLDDLIREVNKIGKPISELFVVSHGSATGTLSFRLFGTSKEPVTQFRDVREGLDTKTLAKPDPAVFTAATTVHIKGCNVGRGSAMGNALDEAFGGAAKVITSTHWQGYRLRPGSSTYEEGFTGYYLELPGDVTLTDDELKEKLAKKYPWVSAGQWTSWLKELKTSRKLVRKRVFWVDQWDDQATQERSGKKFWSQEEFRKEAATKKSGRPDLLVYGTESIGRPGASRQYAEELSTQWALRSKYLERDGALFAPTEKEKPDYLTTSTFGDPPAATPAQAQPAAPQAPAAATAAPAVTASRISVDVHVVKTEDWTGADEVYVRIVGPGGVATSDIHKLNDGQKFTFSLPAKPFGDFTKPVKIEVYDEDWPDADDLIVRMTWNPPYGAIRNTASFDEADYRVVARLS
jgi:hypothetical protein